MRLGRWYDPIGRRWHEPRELRPEPPTSAYESEAEKGYRIASERAIWEAVTATAQATQQESKP